MHQPRDIDTAEKAKYSLVYEELYHFQETILKRSEEHRKTAEEAKKSADGSKKSFEETLSPRQKQLLARLPFELTEDQKKVIYEMNVDIDLSNNQPDIPLAKPDNIPGNKAVGHPDTLPQNVPASPNPDGRTLTSESDVSASDGMGAQTPQFHMARLLQGDVGSGKTLAAFFAALRTICLRTWSAPLSMWKR